MNAGKFRFRSKRLNRLEMKDEDGVERIPDIISRSHLFSVTFTDPQYFHTAGRTVKDSRIKEKAAHLLKYLRPFSELTEIDSEKGVLGDGSRFSDRCLFKFIEDVLKAKEGFLVCDDLGTEWADFVQFESGNRPLLRFIHAKHRDGQAGATPFHDIVSQALKNLGFLCRSDEIYVQRQSTKWIGKHGDLQVERQRSLNGYGTAAECIKNVVQNPQLERSVVLVVSFLSKSEFEGNIDRLELVENHSTQRVWLLTTFISSCLEVGIRPEIWCQP